MVILPHPTPRASDRTTSAADPGSPSTAATAGHPAARLHRWGQWSCRAAPAAAPSRPRPREAGGKGRRSQAARAEKKIDSKACWTSSLG
eukprot:5870910-Prymnesium_polylepis.1